MDNGIALVGAPRTDTSAGQDAGRAYVFEPASGGWGRVQALDAPANTGSAQFGAAVDVEDGLAVIGAPAAGSTGGAYVFEDGPAGWTRTATLVPAQAETGDRVGEAVSVDGDRVLVGAPAASSTGEAYVFEDGSLGWTHTATLGVQDPQGVARFAEALALDGDQALVGASWSAGGGRAFVFQHEDGTWDQTATLAPSGSHPSGFGSDVALDGSTALVGEPGYRDRNSGSDWPDGRVHVFARTSDGWRDAEVWQGGQGDLDGGWGDVYGASVALQGEIAVVGATVQETIDDDVVPGRNTGSALVMRQVGPDWIREAELIPNRNEDWGYMGTSVALDAGHGPLDASTILVGAPGDNLAPDQAAGNAYVFEERISVAAGG